MSEESGRVSTPHGEGRIVSQVADDIVVVEFVGGTRRTYFLDELGEAPVHGKTLLPLPEADQHLTGKLEPTGG